MVLSYQEADAHVAHTLGGEPHPTLPKQHIINGAGRFFMNHYPWQWSVGRSTRLSWKANIDLSAATWDEGSLTLTLTAAFTNYNFNEGDRLEITAGANAAVGKVVEVESRTNDDAIVLKETISAQIDPDTAAGSADTNTDIAGTIEYDYLELPSDFGEITAIDATDSLLRELNPTSLAHILELRSNPIEVTTWYYWVAVNHQVLDNGGVTPILEIWPTPNSTEFGTVTIFYRSTWNNIGDGDMVPIPDFCQEYFLQILRAFARGYEEEDAGTLDQRITGVIGGPIGRAARRFDGAQQSNMWLGPILNGAIQMVSTPEQTPFARSPVAHPS